MSDYTHKNTNTANIPELGAALEEAQALTHLGSWQWDVASGAIIWSDELYRIYGLKPEEHDQVSFDEFMGMIHADDRERVRGIIYTAYETTKPFEFEHRIVRPNKTERILHGKGRVVTDDSGSVVRMLGTSQDITERKKAEEALKRSDERFKTVTQATHDLVYDLNLPERSIWFNEVLYQDYGYGKHQAENTWDWWLGNIHPEDAPRVHEEIHTLQANQQESWQTEYRFKKADDSYAVVRNRAFVLRDSEGNAERIIGSLLDITAQKQLEDAKDEFLSLVSHQLRTPLTATKLSSEMLEQGIAGELSTEQKEYLGRITAASARMISLVGDILNISRIELGRVKVEPVPTDINRLIEKQLEELRPVAEEKCGTLEFTADKKIPKINVDADVLKLMLENLLSNAIRYCHAGEGRVEVAFKKAKQGYVLSVSDNGIGIPAATQKKIFHRFYRADNAMSFNTDGTGIGLYLVKIISDAVGAKTWFESTKNQGTTFYIQLPPSGMKARKGKLRLEQQR